MADATRTIKVRFDGDASGVARASKVAQKAVDDLGKDAGKSFTTRFRQFLLGGKDNKAPQAGAVFGAAFGSGILKGLSTAASSPIILGIILGAVAAAAPVIGGVLATGIIAGLGAGLVGLGAVVAAKSQAVQDAWSVVVARLGESLTEISAPFEAVLINIAGMVRREWFNAFAFPLNQVFKDLAPAFEEFTADVLVAFQELAPAIKPVSDAFIALLGAIGPELPGIMEAIAGNIIEIADTVAKNPEAFAFFFLAALESINAVLAVISVLADVWTSVVKHWNSGVQSALVAMATLASGVGFAVEAIIGHFGGLVDTVLASVENMLKAVGSIPGPFGAPFRLAAAEVGEFRDEVARNFDQAVGKVQDWRTAVENMPKEIKLKGDINDLRQKIDDAKVKLALVPPEKRVKVTADITALQKQLFQARLNLAQLQGKTVYIDVVTRQRVVLDPRSTAGGTTAFGGSDGAFASADTSQLSRTQPAIQVQPSFNVFINGVTTPADVDVKIAESESRQAWRANVGRR